MMYGMRFNALNILSILQARKEHQTTRLTMMGKTRKNKKQVNLRYTCVEYTAQSKLFVLSSLNFPNMKTE